jgi:hypothetical protein
MKERTAHRNRNAWQILFLCPVFVILLFPGCDNADKDIVVLTRTLKSDVESSTAVPQEFGTLAGTTTTVWWVEGTVQNKGTTDKKGILLSFKCSYANVTKVLTAELGSIPSGKTVTFKTRTFASPYNLQLKEDEPPEVRFEK